MVDMGFVVATNKVILAGHRQSVELEIQTLTGMVPGVYVKHGATNNEMVVGTSSELAYGWLGYEDTPLPWRPATIDTTYIQKDSVNPRAAAVYGPGMIVSAWREANATIVMGDKLQGSGSGLLVKWVPVTDNATTGVAGEMPIAIAMEDGSGDANARLIVRSLI